MSKSSKPIKVGGAILVTSIIVAPIRTPQATPGVWAPVTSCRGGGAQPAGLCDGEAGTHGFLGSGCRKPRVRITVSLEPPDLRTRVFALRARTRAEGRVRRMSDAAVRKEFTELLREKVSPQGAMQMLEQRLDGRYVRQDFGDYGRVKSLPCVSKFVETPLRGTCHV